MDILKSEVVVAFKEACENGHVNVVNQFLSERVELNGLKADLEAAVLNGDLKVVNLLIVHEVRLGLARVETVELRTQVRRFIYITIPGGRCWRTYPIN